MCVVMLTKRYMLYVKLYLFIFKKLVIHLTFVTKCLTKSLFFLIKRSIYICTNITKTFFCLKLPFNISTLANRELRKAILNTYMFVYEWLL